MWSRKGILVLDLNVSSGRGGSSSLPHSSPLPHLWPKQFKRHQTAPCDFTGELELSRHLATLDCHRKSVLRNPSWSSKKPHNSTSLPTHQRAPRPLHNCSSSHPDKAQMPTPRHGAHLRRPEFPKNERQGVETTPASCVPGVFQPRAPPATGRLLPKGQKHWVGRAGPSPPYLVMQPPPRPSQPPFW